MKSIFFALIISPLFSISQEIDVDTLKFDFSEVVTVEALNAKALHSNAKLYIANAFMRFHLKTLHN